MGQKYTYSNMNWVVLVIEKALLMQISFVEWPLNHWSHYDCLQIYLRALKYDSFDTVILRGHKRYKGKVQGAKHRSEKANHWPEQVRKVIWSHFNGYRSWKHCANMF